MRCFCYSKDLQRQATHFPHITKISKSVGAERLLIKAAVPHNKHTISGNLYVNPMPSRVLKYLSLYANEFSLNEAEDFSE